MVRPDADHPDGAPMASSFDSNSGLTSPRTRNVKAEAMADAHKQRVEAEVNAYLQSEIRKTEARAATAESKIEQKRMKDEARAIEHKKREEAKAEQAIRTAEVCFIFTKTHFVIHRI